METQTPQQRIEADLKTAMKASDKERTSTLRMLLADLKNEKIKRGAEVDDAAFAAVLRRAIKQRQEAAAQYRTGGRPESAAREEAEAGLFEIYLPRQAGDDELRAAAAEFLAAQGLSGPAATGPTMKAMIARFGANAESAAISRIVRELLAPR
jgi:uncharacterized protein